MWENTRCREVNRNAKRNCDNIVQIGKDISTILFFAVMVHLCVYLPNQALLGGLVSNRWMFGLSIVWEHIKGMLETHPNLMVPLLKPMLLTRL